MGGGSLYHASAGDEGALKNRSWELQIGGVAMAIVVEDYVHPPSVRCLRKGVLGRAGFAHSL
jgi:hypothetical protein